MLCLCTRSFFLHINRCFLRLCACFRKRKLGASTIWSVIAWQKCSPTNLWEFVTDHTDTSTLHKNWSHVRDRDIFTESDPKVANSLTPTPVSSENITEYSRIVLLEGNDLEIWRHWKSDHNDYWLLLFLLQVHHWLASLFHNSTFQGEALLMSCFSYSALL